MSMTSVKLVPDLRDFNKLLESCIEKTVRLTKNEYGVFAVMPIDKYDEIASRLTATKIHMNLLYLT